MKKILIRIASKVSSLLMKLIGRLMIYAGGDAAGRLWLGRIFNLSMISAHDTRIIEIKRKFDIHSSVSIGIDTFIFGDGKISIGEGTYIGQHSFIVAHPSGSKIVIGRCCAISHGVHIRTASYKTNLHFKEALLTELDQADIVIGDYVWIGANVFIKGGVTIGSNSVVGANSVVTDDVPNDAVCGGVPARLIKYKEKIQEMDLGGAPSGDREDKVV